MRLRYWIGFIVGCGACDGPAAPAMPTPPSASAEPGPAPAAAPGVAPQLPLMTPTRVSASATVLERAGAGVQLCLGEVLESLPPQCSGLPIVGWDWAKVDSKEQAGTTTWGVYQVVGQFDGRTFTLTEPPGLAWGEPQRPRTSVPCPTPSGGWAFPDPKRATYDQVRVVDAAARGLPGYAGLWLHAREERSDGVEDMSKVVLVVAFAGDANAHTAALRKLWGGALCVVQRTYDEAGLARIQRAAEQTLTELGVDWLTSDADEVGGVVRLGVPFVRPEILAKVDAKFGAGVVVLEPRLRPYPSEPGKSRTGQLCTDGEFMSSGCVCNDRQCMDICCVGSI